MALCAARIALRCLGVAWLALPCIGVAWFALPWRALVYFGLVWLGFAWRAVAWLALPSASPGSTEGPPRQSAPTRQAREHIDLLHLLWLL